MGNYMEVSNQLVPVNVKAVPQPQSKPTVKKQDKEDKTEQIIVGLTGAAAVAIAGIALAKTGKGKELLGKLKNIGKDKADDVAAIVKDKADDAVAALAKGENYGKVKEEALKNLDHAGKKVVKEQALKPGLDARRIAEAAQKKQIIQQGKTAAHSHGKIKTVYQGMKNASAAEVEAKIKVAQDAAAKSQQVADAMAEMAKQGTKKSTKRATYYATKATQDALKAKAVAEEGAKRIDQLAQEAVKKAANKAKYASHLTTESIQKMEENAQKAAKKAAERVATREASRPGIQRAFAKYKNYSKEQLEHLIRSPKIKAADKKVAQALLESLAK